MQVWTAQKAWASPHWCGKGDDMAWVWGISITSETDRNLSLWSNSSTYSPGEYNDLWCNVILDQHVSLNDKFSILVSYSLAFEFSLHENDHDCITVYKVLGLFQSILFVFDWSGVNTVTDIKSCNGFIYQLLLLNQCVILYFWTESIWFSSR